VRCTVILLELLITDVIELSALTCNECDAFEGLQEDHQRCPHQFALALTGYLDSLGHLPLESNKYIKLVLENDWIWGIAIAISHRAKRHDCDVLGLHMARKGDVAEGCGGGDVTRSRMVS